MTFGNMSTISFYDFPNTASADHGGERRVLGVHR